MKEIPNRLFVDGDDFAGAVLPARVTAKQYRDSEDDVMYIREGAEAVSAPAWISVDEKMPPYDTNVLAVFEEECSVIAYGVAELVRQCNGACYWEPYSKVLEAIDIVAWMPIPEYKSKEELNKCD